MYNLKCDNVFNKFYEFHKDFVWNILVVCAYFTNFDTFSTNIWIRSVKKNLKKNARWYLKKVAQEFPQSLLLIELSEAACYMHA